MKYAAFIFIYFSLCFAGAETKTCADVFSNSSVAKPLKKLPFLNNSSYNDTRPTVKILSIVENQRGETFYHLQKLLEEQSWNSRYGRHRYDPQGDPRHSMERWLGLELARVVGFHWNRRGDIFAPTPETVNRRIRIFNVFLEQKGIAPIPVSFYVQQQATIDSFLYHWAKNRGVPVAGALDTHTIHDIVFHYSAVLLAPRFIQFIQLQAAVGWKMWVTENRKSYASKPPHLGSPVTLLTNRIDVLSNLANAIDLAHPKYSPRLVGQLAQQFFKKSPEDASFIWHLHAQETMLDMLTSNQFMAEHPYRYLDFVAQNKSRPDYIAKLRERRLRGLPEMRILNEIEKEFPDLGKTYEEWGFGTATEAFDMFANRANEIRSAAAEFIQTNPF